MERDDTTPGYADNSAGAPRRTLAERASLPPPPAMHWGLVILYGVLSLGIFLVVWPFIQANWVRRIDPHSRATSLLAASLACTMLGYFLTNAGASDDIAAPMSNLMRLGLLLQLVHVALYLIAYFAMAASIRRELARYQVPVRIGAVSLFFLNTLYLQGQLRWLARWQQTGRTLPQPPKAVIWACVSAPVMAIVAALAVPFYQLYVVRVQVAGALAQAEPLKQQMMDAIGRNRAWPQNNAQAGLQDAEAYASDKLSGFTVVALYDGSALVTRFNESAHAALRGKRLALVAEAQGGSIVWHCESPDLNPHFLPEQCLRGAD